MFFQGYKKVMRFMHFRGFVLNAEFARIRRWAGKGNDSLVTQEVVSAGLQRQIVFPFAANLQSAMKLLKAVTGCCQET